MSEYKVTKKLDKSKVNVEIYLTKIKELEDRLEIIKFLGKIKNENSKIFVTKIQNEMKKLFRELNEKEKRLLNLKNL